MITKKVLTGKDYLVRPGDRLTVFYRDDDYIARRYNDGPIEFWDEHSPKYKASLSIYRLHSKQYDRLTRIVVGDRDKRATELFWDYTCAIKGDNGLVDYHEIWLYRSMLLK